MKTVPMCLLFLAQPPIFLAQPPIFLAQPPIFLAQPPIFLAQPPVFLSQSFDIIKIECSHALHAKCLNALRGTSTGIITRAETPCFNEFNEKH